MGFWSLPFSSYLCLLATSIFHCTFGLVGPLLCSFLLIGLYFPLFRWFLSTALYFWWYLVLVSYPSVLCSPLVTDVVHSFFFVVPSILHLLQEVFWLRLLSLPFSILLWAYTSAPLIPPFSLGIFCFWWHPRCPSTPRLCSSLLLLLPSVPPFPLGVFCF